MNDDKLRLREFRSELPLTDADFDSIRAGVMARIAGEKRWSFFGPGWRLALATIVIAVLGLTALLTLRRSEPAIPSTPVATRPRTVPQTIAPPAIAAAEPAPSVASVASAHPARRHHRARRQPTRPLSVAAAGPRLIQLQTSNPDIRIIWIAR